MALSGYFVTKCVSASTSWIRAFECQK